MFKEKHKKAFTLVELTITVTLFSLVMLITSPIVLSQLQGASTEATARQIVDYLFDAQQSAYNRKNRSAAGVDKCFGVSFAKINQKLLTTFNSDYVNGICNTTRNSTDIGISGSSDITAGLIDVTFVPGSLKPVPQISTSWDIVNFRSKYSVYITDEGSIFYKPISF